jgi:hypothetical protein
MDDNKEGTPKGNWAIYPAGVWALIFVLGALVFFIYFGIDRGPVDRQKESLASEEPADQPLAHGFIEGELIQLNPYGWGNGTTAEFCGNARYSFESEPGWEQPMPCNPHVQIHIDTDVLIVIGPPQHFDSARSENGWWWPVRGVRSGIYTQAVEGWVPDDRDWVLLDGDIGPRPTPIVSLGETALTSYNFLVRKSPAGATKPLPDGNPDWIEGNQPVTLLENPVIGDDGHYWCNVEGWGTNGWIPCELQLTE